MRATAYVPMTLTTANSMPSATGERSIMPGERRRSQGTSACSAAHRLNVTPAVNASETR